MRVARLALRRLEMPSVLNVRSRVGSTFLTSIRELIGSNGLLVPLLDVSRSTGTWWVRGAVSFEFKAGHAVRNRSGNFNAQFVHVCWI